MHIFTYVYINYAVCVCSELDTRVTGNCVIITSKSACSIWGARSSAVENERTLVV